MATPILDKKAEMLVAEGPGFCLMALANAELELRQADNDALIRRLQWEVNIAERAVSMTGITVKRSSWTGQIEEVEFPIRESYLTQYLLDSAPDDVSVPGVGEVKRHSVDRRHEYPGVRRWIDV
jgi:hypothetical protein